MRYNIALVEFAFFLKKIGGELMTAPKEFRLHHHNHVCDHYLVCGVFASLCVTTALIGTATFMFAEEAFSVDMPPASPVIIGGQPAEVGEWPWQAHINAGSRFCGGVLVAPIWVLTAAHCLYDRNRQLVTEEIWVTLGDYDQAISEPSEQRYRVQQVILHPSYNAVYYYHDIVLLQLSESAYLTTAVAPILPIVSPADDLLVVEGTLATVTGWGVTSEQGARSAPLMEVAVPLISNAACNRVYGTITDDLLCAGYDEGGKDSCQGDSGGPLVVPDGAGGWKLAGLVHSGFGCARPGYYGIYLRASTYAAWWEQYTGAPSLALTPTPTLIATRLDESRLTPEPVTPVPTEAVTLTPVQMPLTTTLVTETLFYLPLIQSNTESQPLAVDDCALGVQEARLLALVAAEPRQGRTLLRCNPILTRVARARALDLGQRQYFSHVNPDGFGPNYLVRAAGYPLPATYGTAPTSNNIESIGAGVGEADLMWNAWLGSTKHSIHLLGLENFYAEQIDYGIGFAHVPDSPYQFYWVFISAKPAVSLN